MRGSIIHLSVKIQPTQFSHVFSTVNPVDISGTGFVVDALQLLECPIPLIGETQASMAFTDAKRESLKIRLKQLGIPETEDGKFLIIVTNAHVVHGQKSIQFQMDNDSRFYKILRVLTIFAERDLAIILPDPHIAKTLVPLKISSEMPAQNEKLITYGYPKNAIQLCVSEGAFKRLISTIYSHSGHFALAYEVATPTNGGDSGAPVFNAQSEVVAVHFQHVTDANGQAHHIPITQLIAAVRGFVAHGRDVGVFSLPISLRTLQNETERQYYDLDPQGNDGVLIRDLGNHHVNALMPGDILLSINTIPIDSSGNIDLLGNRSTIVPLKVYLHFFQLNDEITITLKRNKTLHTVIINLTTPTRAMLKVSSLPPTRAPLAFYRQGIAFVEPVSTARTKDENSIIRKEPVYSAVQARYMGSNLCGVVYGLFMSDTIQGYGSNPFIVDKINDIAIRDLWHAYLVVTAAVKSGEPFLRIYSDRYDEVPSYVVKVCDEAGEKHNRELFTIPERFSTLASPVERNPIIGQFWKKVREEALRVGRATLAIRRAEPTSTTQDEDDQGEMLTPR